MSYCYGSVGCTSGGCVCHGRASLTPRDGLERRVLPRTTPMPEEELRRWHNYLAAHEDRAMSTAGGRDLLAEIERLRAALESKNV